MNETAENKEMDRVDRRRIKAVLKRDSVNAGIRAIHALSAR